MIVFAQFSDTHLNEGQDRARRAAAAVAYLNGLDVALDAVLVTGDIADHGLPAEYRQARAIWSSSRHPVLSCPGNHDARAAYRQALAKPVTWTPVPRDGAGWQRDPHRPANAPSPARGSAAPVSMPSLVTRIAWACPKF